MDSLLTLNDVTAVFTSLASKPQGFSMSYVNDLAKFIDDIDGYMRNRIKFEAWVKKCDPRADCWNISTICAEYLALKGEQPVIYSITGPLVAHLECVTENNGKVTSYFVTPHNEIPEENFRFISQEWNDFNEWMGAWDWYLSQKYDDELLYEREGSVSGGMEVRELLSQLISSGKFFADKGEGPIRLIEFEPMRQKLKEKLK